MAAQQTQQLDLFAPAPDAGAPSVTEQAQAPEAVNVPPDTLACCKDHAPADAPVARDTAPEPVAPPARDRNFRLPDDVLDRGSWAPVERLQGNLQAIELLRDLERLGAKPDDDQCRTLAQYAGWGGLPRAVQARSYGVADPSFRQVSELLDDDELEGAANSIVNGFYTSREIIDAMWAAVRRLGFVGGQVLEPAAGIGHFLGRRPSDIGCTFTAVELEPVAARIAGQLYPDAKVLAQAYEKVQLADDTFDLAISNVPFGEYGVVDKRYTGRRLPSIKVHDYFFVKTLDKVREGGLVAFVTSTGTLDKRDGRVRALMHRKADLVAAFRLPAGAFHDSAGTQAGADILFLRKRFADEVPGDDTWVNRDGLKTDINPYFEAHPEHLLGELVESMGMYGRPGREVRLGFMGDLPRLLDDAVATLPADIAQRRAPSKGESKPERKVITLDGGVHDTFGDADFSPYTVGAFVLTESGQLCQIEGKSGDDLDMVEADISSRAAQRVALMLPVRDAAYEVIATQVHEASDGALQQAQAKLQLAYDAFVKRFGPISRKANTRAIARDPSVAVLLSLEYYDEDTDTATPTEIFTERTIGRPDTVERVDTPEDALAVCLNRKGRLEPATLAQLLDVEWTEAREILRGLIFHDPEHNCWEVRGAYLSGNVVAKLAAAREAADQDPAYTENVEALEAIQPEPLGPGEISVRLGSPWVPEWVIAQFVGHILGMGVVRRDGIPEHRQTPGVRVANIKAMGEWQVELQRHDYDRSTWMAWGTEDYDPLKLITYALNQKVPVVWAEDAEGHKYRDEEATAEAQSKQTRIKEEFRDWVWSEPERADELTAIYNDQFNCMVERVYDGSHLSFPGLSRTRQYRPVQANFIWRVIESGNALAAHVVGAGKTGSMVGAAMECKRLGLARKPLAVVPNNLLYQFAAECLRFYPSARVLIATKEDLSAQGRRQFIARVASRNWDLVVMTHESFGRLPMSAAYKQRFVADEISEYKAMIAAADAGSSFSGSMTEKRLRTAIKRLEARLEKLIDQEGRDNEGLCFEALGVDMLLVDEAHQFKNLEVKTKMGSVPGVNTTGSKRAEDLYMKSRWIMDNAPVAGRNLVFATGTSISNSMVEMYTMKRYMAPDLLYAHGIEHFDAWAANFGEIVASLERAPEGTGYRVNQRFAKFVNVPEMARLFRTFADVVDQERAGLPVPRVEQHHHAVDGPPELRGYMRELGKRAKEVRAGLVHKTEDNILKIANDGRHASLDVRTVLPEAGDDENNKAHEVARKVAYYYHAEPGNVQLAFCDLSTPKKHRFSLYHDLRDKLMAAGIPAAEIAFAQDAKTDNDRERLYAAMRAGRVRVVLGSTAKMGMGMNAQDRITDIHHIDAPWRPADVAQRDGRGVRQGNTNDLVRVHTYITKDSYDEFMWETLKRKASFIAQALTSPADAVREIEEIVEPKYAEIMAIATGNPLVKEKVELDDQVERLERAARQHRNDQYRVRRRMTLIEETYLPEARALHECLAADAEAVGQLDSLAIETDQGVIQAEAKIAKHLQELTKGAWAVSWNDAGRIAGIPVKVRRATDHKGRARIAMLWQGSYERELELPYRADSLIEKLSGFVFGLGPRAEDTAEYIKDLEREHEGLTAQLGATFEHEAELTQARERKAEVDKALLEAEKKLEQREPA